MDRRNKGGVSEPRSMPRPPSDDLAAAIARLVDAAREVRTLDAMGS